MAQNEMPKLFSELAFLRHKFYNQLVDSLFTKNIEISEEY